MELYFQGSNLILLLLGVVIFLFFFVQIYYYLHYFSGVIRQNRKIAQGKVKFSAERPPVSIIICARNEEENLRNFLPKIMEQDYPDFEVILVNDGSEDNTENVLNSFAEQYPNLYITNVPIDTNIISRKKLAITIGVKAAKNELLLFTDADCYPVSDQWINLMVRNLDKNTEVVIGYGDYIREKTFISKLISYDTLFIAMQYLGFAYSGKPYMGVGRNLMYKRSTFYQNKGFAGHLHISSGDDDLLVNKVGNRENTAIACTAESKTMSIPEATFTKWLKQKQRHLKASSLYSPQSRRWIGVEAITRFGFYFSLLAIIFTFNIKVIAFALLLFAIRYTIQVLVVNNTSKRLGSAKHFISIILFDIMLPIISLWLLTKNMRIREGQVCPS